MDWIRFVSNIKRDDILHFLEKYEALGPLPGVLIPFIETFLPFFPILVIIIGNAAAYGLWKGFFFSWLGVVLGSIGLFLLTRQYGSSFTSFIETKFRKGKDFLNWIEKKGFTPIFFMSCLPFTPSFLINVVSGLSQISSRSFIIAIALGKAFMIFLVSLIGSDFFTLFHHPWKLIFISSLFLLIWVVGKSLESHYNRRYYVK